MGWSGSENEHLGSQLLEILAHGGRDIHVVLYGDDADIWFLLDTDDGPVIMLILVEYRNGIMMCKDISENMGPAACDCPLELLDKAPETCPEWRAEVRRYHETQKVFTTVVAQIQIPVLKDAVDENGNED